MSNPLQQDEAPEVFGSILHARKAAPSQRGGCCRRQEIAPFPFLFMVTLNNILGSAELAEGFTAETFQFALEQPFGPEGQEVLCRQVSKGKCCCQAKLMH